MANTVQKETASLREGDDAEDDDTPNDEVAAESLVDAGAGLPNTIKPCESYKAVDNWVKLSADSLSVAWNMRPTAAEDNMSSSAPRPQ